ncbi:MAG: glycosyltransferase family A protein [Terriglobales bacterium]
MISVIIPAKNEAVTLWFTIHAIRMEMDRCSEEPYEIIVVDNGSTDNTKKFLEDYSIAPWVRRIEKTDCSGPGPARIAGAEAAQGDIFVFADAHVLVSPGFFARVSSTMRNEIWDRVGSLHFPIGWNGFEPGEFSTHYELTLGQNFWGTNQTGNFQTLTEISAHGHGCVAMRRDHFLKVGGYHPAQVGYGGEEVYLDLKFAMFGFRNYTDPRAHYLHCSQRQMNYVWVNQDVARNNFISAYTLGGRPWLDKVYFAQLEAGYVPEHELRPAREDALLAGQADREWIEAHARFTVDEVLAGFKERQVPH